MPRWKILTVFDFKVALSSGNFFSGQIYFFYTSYRQAIYNTYRCFCNRADRRKPMYWPISQHLWLPCNIHFFRRFASEAEVIHCAALRRVHRFSRITVVPFVSGPPFWSVRAQRQGARFLSLHKTDEEKLKTV